MPTPQSFVPVVSYRFTITVEDQETFHTSNLSTATYFASQPKCVVWDHVSGSPYKA